MRRLVLLLPLLAACTPSPRKAAMPSPIPSAVPPASTDAGQAAAGSAALGPIPEPVSAAGVAAPTTPTPIADSPAAALGRRTLSTAFVRVGPDGHLTVELHDGRTLVLRDVEMGPKDYCGALASGKRHCGGYADVAAARPGGAPVADASDPGTGARATPTG